MDCKVNDPRIIVALDFTETGAARNLARRLEPGLCRLKVGKELFTHAGPELVTEFIQQGFDVFLDLKFHDIPATVSKACTAAANLGVWMLNVHASGGERMLCEARESIDSNDHRPLLIAVTVLTSMNDADLRQTGVHNTVLEQVMALARLTEDCGLDGVVCSAEEAAILRKVHGRDFVLVTPGIRPGGTGRDDQQRVKTPAQAIRGGSDYLVIGRPITQAVDPLKMLREINVEIKNASCI